MIPAAAPLGTIVDTLVSASRPRTTSQRDDLPAPAPAPAQFAAALKDGTVLMKGVGLGGYASSYSSSQANQIKSQASAMPGIPLHFIMTPSKISQ